MPKRDMLSAVKGTPHNPYTHARAAMHKKTPRRAGRIRCRADSLRVNQVGVILLFHGYAQNDRILRH